MSAYGTVLDIVNDTALLLGIRAAGYAAVFSSTDADAVLLRSLLNAAGRELERSYQWTQLETEYTFSTVNGTASYSLPAGYSRLIPRTEWNRTDLQAIGPALSAQDWQYLKGSGLTALVRTAFRVRGRTLYLYPTPSASETVALEYLSSYWVAPTGQAAPTLDAATADTDTVWFDKLLMVYRIRRDYLRQRGMESMAASDDYDRLLATVLGGDGEARVVALGGMASHGPPLDPAINLPDTFTG